MTPFPYSIDVDAPLSRATSMIAEHDFHHLPVTSPEGKLVGVVTQKDLLVATALGKDNVTVSDVNTLDPYVVSLKTPLLGVVRHMAEQKIEAALVTRQDKLVGILTTTDLAGLLAKLLEAQFPEPTDPEIA
jgi:acetoin utilization protein AcuB